MGINWWQYDPALCSGSQRAAPERDQLAQRLDRLETMLTDLADERAKRRPAPPAIPPTR